MTRATERWQETMRYAVDTGAVPLGPRRSRWPWALAAVVGTAALVLAGAASSGRGPGNRAWVDPDRPATALASAGPAAEPARKRSYTRNAGAEANAAAEPAAVHSHIAAAREPLDRPEPATTGAIAAAPHDEAAASRTPVIRCAPRSGQAGEAPELAPSPAPIGAGRIRAAPGQESSGRRTRRRRQARSGADRVERPRAAPRITGGGREYPPRVGRGGRAGTACQRLPLLRCLFLDALASAAKGPLPCRETEEDEMCQRGFGTRQLDQALCRLCDRGRGSAGPVDQPTSGTALPMTRASSSLEAVLSRKAIGSAAAARCRVSSSE